MCLLSGLEQQGRAGCMKLNFISWGPAPRCLSFGVTGSCINRHQSPPESPGSRWQGIGDPCALEHEPRPRPGPLRVSRGHPDRASRSLDRCACRGGGGAGAARRGVLMDFAAFASPASVRTLTTATHTGEPPFPFAVPVVGEREPRLAKDNPRDGFRQGRLARARRGRFARGRGGRRAPL